MMMPVKYPLIIFLCSASFVFTVLGFLVNSMPQIFVRKFYWKYFALGAGFLMAAIVVGVAT